jgi:putative ABC transport system permease protein
MVRQILVLSYAALAGIPRRLALSLSMALSVALVVAVLIGFLSMATGFQRALGAGGSADIAVVLSGSGIQEVGSDIPPDVARNLEASGAAAGIASDPSGHLLVSREILVAVEAGAAGGSPRMVALRGMGAEGPALRSRVSIYQGRLFTLGSREIVMGARLARDLGGLVPGQSIRLGPIMWTVVGLLSADGGIAESEIWADLESVRSAFDRQSEIQTLRVALTTAGGRDKLQAAVAATSPTSLTVVSEEELLSAQSSRIERLVTLFGWPIAVLMAFGATAGALTTMMSSVSDRAAEIATLRVIGFSRRAVFTATFLEATVLSLAGGVIGSVASVALLDGWEASTLGASGAQLAFQLSVTPWVMLQAGALALIVGCLGGALPAFTAARLPLVSALRSNG